MIITEIQYFFSKIIRFQAIFKDTVEFTCALEFKISSQHGRAFLFDQLVLLIIEITDFSLCIRLPDSVPGFVIGTANRSAVPPLFQKLSPDIISIGDIQRIIPCGDFGSNAAKSYTCLRCAVTVAVIPVCKGEQDIFSRLGFQCADISVPVIGIGGFHTVTIMNAASSAQNSV